MINPTSVQGVAAVIAAVATGTEQEQQITRLGALRTTLLEAQGFELGRAGRSFFGGMTLVAGGVVPVVDLPTTTAPFVLFNSNPSGGKLYHVKQVTGWYASGTAGAFGFGLFGGVTPSVLATALVANGATNFRTQATRGTGAVSGYVDVAKTIPSGTCWMHFGGILHGAATVTGPAYTVDVRHLGIIVPPLFAFALGALGDTGTTAKFGFSIAWDELEGDLP